MATSYTPASAVEMIAKGLIRKHHMHLLGAEVRYVFRSKASKKGSKTVLGRARKMTGLNAWLATGGETDEREVPLAFFLIEIAADTWEELTPSQQEALVDHELCHCAVDVGDDGEFRLGIRSHDLEEFRAVFERHGLWKPDVAAFADTMKRQMSLLDPPAEPEPVTDEERRIGFHITGDSSTDLDRMGRLLAAGVEPEPSEGAGPSPAPSGPSDDLNERFDQMVAAQPEEPTWKSLSIPTTSAPSPT